MLFQRADAAAMEGPSLKLIIEKGPRAGEILEFKPGSAVRIGRLVRGNNLPIKDSSISSKHLSIHFESGHWVVRDLDSSNGTILNDVHIPPDNPVVLSDFDSIKIGELTSITVRIFPREESRLRRNPRRGRAGKEPEVDDVGLMVENRGRKGDSKAVRILEEDGNEADLASVSKVELEKELDDNVQVATKNQGRRGRSKNAKIAVEESDEAQESLRNLDLGTESAKVSHVENESVNRRASRRTRASKKENNLVSSTMLQKIPEISELDSVEIGIEEKKTKVGLRRKRKTKDEAMETMSIDTSTNKGSNCGEKTYRELTSVPGGNELSTEVGDGPDLEKMTLGDWFEYLDVHLAKQIYDATEEIITNMRERGKKVLEYILQQESEKGKQSVC